MNARHEDVISALSADLDALPRLRSFRLRGMEMTRLDLFLDDSPRAVASPLSRAKTETLRRGTEPRNFAGHEVVADTSKELRGYASDGGAERVDIERFIENDLHVHPRVGFANFRGKVRG